MGAFQLLAGANEVVLRLFDLRGHRAALIQWQREVQADLVLPVITVGVGERGIGFRTVVTRIRDPGRGGKVQGRQMAVLRLTNLLAGQVLAQTRLQQRQVAVLRFLQQGVDRLRLVGFKAVHVQGGQLRIVITGDLTQSFDGVVEIVTRGDFVRQHGIVL